MVELRAAIIVIVLMALVFGVVSETDQRLESRYVGWFRKPCANGSHSHSWGSSPANPLPESSPEATTEKEITSLERAHWCRMSNGTYVSLDQSYMPSVCRMCRCTKSHNILCDMVDCMATYCVDNKAPVLRRGQCCTQCDYDLSTEACVVNGTTYPHGAVIKYVERKFQCWCHLGNVECRDYIGTLFEGFNLFGDGPTVYILIFMGIGILFIGLFAFCGFSILFYYYFKQNPHLLQQVYEQYTTGSAGWQPMNEEEQYEEDTNAEEKHLEAERYQSENPTYYALPPAYALHNDSKIPTDEQK